MTVTNDYAANLDLALRAARAAGDAIMPAFRDTPEVRFKDGDQPVTDADLEADRILHRILLGERPGYGWLSEETADSPERLEKARLWVVDPIDGTNSFVKGIPDWVVCVGLVDAGRAVVGVVYNPARGEMYHASAGGGAFRDGQPIRVADAGNDAPVLLASRSELRRGEFARFAEAGWRVEGLGSTAYRMVKVAEGAGHASFSRGGKNEWDVCAADVILAEAGGRTTDMAGAAYRYNRAETRRRGIVATNGRLHDDVLARIHAAG